jgi:uncharacterized protein YjiS (DUF1127 family)
MSTVNLRQPMSYLGLASHAPKWAEEALKQAVAAWRLHAQYRKSVEEMEDLSDRTLSDLGIHRSDIRRVAREAIYGER